jgi:hypothetical protein
MRCQAGRKVIETKIMPQAARPEMMKLLEGELQKWYDRRM